MKKICVLLIVMLLPVLSSMVYGQQRCEKTMEESLQQVAQLLSRPDSRALWNISFNAPIVFVDPMENKVYFTGIEEGRVQAIREEPWDNKIPLANSFYEHDGKKYVTIIGMAFMNSSCDGRVNLLTHEIFHLYQNSLGIQNTPSANQHMDEVEGRALLQIEMKALQKALDGQLQGLRDALCIRAYRQKLYPGNNEELYELNEGLAEYTGAKLSNPNMNEYVKERLNYDLSRGYTNAYGYLTGSAYATLLDNLYPQWKQDADLNKGLTYLIKKSNPPYAESDDSYLNALLEKNQYPQLLSAEKEELKKFGDISLFAELLKPKVAKLYIPNNNVSFTYNPNDRVIALKDAVLLRNLTLKGEWGQIKVRSGVVRLNDWSEFYLLPPTKIMDNVAEGNDYEVTLIQGWKVIDDGGIYKIIKTE